MERASKLIRRLQLPGDPISSQEVACAAWSQSVGKKVAAHTRAVRMVRSRLVIEVPDATWQRQLFALSGQILRNLSRNLGPGLVEDLEFRIVPRRMEPQRANAARSGAPLFEDEAQAIEDPVLRLLYRASRKKALA